MHDSNTKRTAFCSYNGRSSTGWQWLPMKNIFSSRSYEWMLRRLSSISLMALHALVSFPATSELIPLQHEVTWLTGRSKLLGSSACRSLMYLCSHVFLTCLNLITLLKVCN